MEVEPTIEVWSPTVIIMKIVYIGVNKIECIMLAYMG